MDHEKLLLAADMKRLLIRMKQMVHKAEAHGKTALYKAVYQRFKKQYDTITSAALGVYGASPPDKPTWGRIKQPKGKNLLDRLIKYKTETLHELRSALEGKPFMPLLQGC